MFRFASSRSSSSSYRTKDRLYYIVIYYLGLPKDISLPSIVCGFRSLVNYHYFFLPSKFVPCNTLFACRWVWRKNSIVRRLIVCLSVHSCQELARLCCRFFSILIFHFTLASSLSSFIHPSSIILSIIIIILKSNLLPTAGLVLRWMVYRVKNQIFEVDW